MKPGGKLTRKEPSWAKELKLIGPDTSLTKRKVATKGDVEIKTIMVPSDSFQGRY